MDKSEQSGMWFALPFLVFVVFSYFYMRPSASSLDLMALWLAGHFAQTAAPDLIYPPDMGIFTMYPPGEWVDYVRKEYDFFGAVYPYLYPPIWPYLAGKLTSVMDFRAILQFVLLLNCTLLAASMALVTRLVRLRMNPIIFVARSGAILLLTPIGFVALQQAQLQILTTFLILLAIERSRFDHPLMAGLALALAASLKLYPALFAIFWLATGERRAFLSFLISGAILAGLSVLLAGWPLHAEFLRQISIITNTVFVTAVTVNMDGALALLFYVQDMTLVPSLEENGQNAPQQGWFIMYRPLVWKVLQNSALLVIVALLWRGFRNAERVTRYSTLWPLALTLIPLISPMAWAYYYIPTVLFAVTLPDRLGWGRGLTFLALGAIPMLMVLFPFYLSLHLLVWMFPAVAVACLLVWCAGFALSARQSRQNSR